MNKAASQPSVALVYDRVNTPFGGAENVLLVLHELYPDAPLYTSLYAANKAPWAQRFPMVYASFLNKLPLLRTMHRWLAVLMPTAFESLDLSKYDIIISVTSAEAKGVLTNPKQLHVCYLLTPPRYLYHHYRHSLDSHWLLRLPIIRQLAQLLINYLRWWDQAAIFRPDVIIPISKRVAKRVEEFYSKVEPDQVIYPPVNANQFNKIFEKPASGEAPNFLRDLTANDYLLVISRLVSHKKIKLAIHACANLNKDLVIVGNGPEQGNLIKLAKSLSTDSRILFFDSLTDDQLQEAFQRCQALIMPGEEDFGIVAMEANSFGKPVIINRRSGAAELIKSGEHGVHIKEESVPATIQAIEKLEGKSFSTSKIAKNPLKYDTKQFKQIFSQAIAACWKEQQKA
jgi:glycosyltransferase involved in cell wall biosynthesis